MSENKTSAFWVGDTLMINWYGGTPDEAAYWQNNHSSLIFEGYDETLKKTFVSKPSADEALTAITNWQNS